MPSCASTAIVHPGVEWGGDFTIGHFVIIGEPARGRQPGERPVHIGPGALIRSHTTIYDGNKIGRDFQTGHFVLIREDNEVGDEVSVGSSSVIEHHVTIGHRVRIHTNVFVPEYTVLEEGCWLGPNVVLTNAKYPRSPRVKERLMGPCIERGAKIGANATILPGVRIGREALVGAGAVVTRDVSPGDVVAGNPSRIINHIAHLPYGTMPQ